MTKGEDLRVVKSIREIKQAFLRLILKKPMDKIKISVYLLFAYFSIFR